VTFVDEKMWDCLLRWLVIFRGEQLMYL